MTEDDARSKFCCGPNGGPDLTRPGLCVGSECMAWRTLTAMNRDNPTRAAEVGHYKTNMGGFCGLAGRP